MSADLARTQSLADMAKRAEDASTANKVYTPTFSNANMVNGASGLGRAIMLHPLTMAELRTWAAVMHDLAAACATDKKLATRVMGATAWATGIGEIERAYILEPAIGALFAKHRMSAHDFVMTQISFEFALQAARDRQFALRTVGWGGQLPANAEVVRMNREEAEAIAKDMDRLVVVHID